MSTFLLCPPQFYGIEYEINPWMSKDIQAIPYLAWKQWRALHETLQQLGIRIEQVLPQSGLPDMVFTANAGLIHGKQFFSSRFRYPVRQGETPHYEQWFEEMGYQIVVPPAGLCFEGEGDALWVGETLFVGCCIRTDPATLPWLSGRLNKRVIPLELVDPRFYHLDTCFCPLDSDRVLYYPPAFSDASLDLILAMIPRPIPIQKNDAVQFGANAIIVDNHAVIHAGGVALAKTLVEEGLTVHPLDFSEFIKAGGSAKCLVLKLS